MATTEVANLFVGIQGDATPLKRSLDKANRDVKSFKGKMNRSLSGVDRAFGRLGASIGKMGKALTRLGPSIVGVAGVAGLGLLVKRSLDAADTIGKTADGIGVTTDALQEYRFAAQLAGVETSTIDNAFQAFGKRLGELRVGTGTLTTFLSKYSGELQKSIIATSNADEALDLIFDSMANMTDQSKKAALAAAAFGRTAGVRMVNLVRGGTKELKAMRQEARDLGLVLDEKLIRSAEQTKDELTRLGAVISSRVTTVILQNAEAIAKAAAALTDWVIATSKFLGLIERSDIEKMKELNEALAFAKSSGVALAGGLGPERQFQQQQKILDVMGKIFDLQQKIDASAAARGRLTAPATPGAAVPGGATGAVDSKLATTMRKALDTEQKALERARDKAIRFQNQITANFERATQSEIELIVTRTDRQIAELEKLRLTEEEKAAARVLINQTADADIRASSDARIADQVSGLREVVDGEQRAKAAAEEMGSAMTSAFGDAIIEGEKFSDVLRGLLKDVSRIVLKFAEASLTDSIKGGGGLGGLFGNLFGGGGGGIPISDSAGVIAGPFAHGGSFTVGGAGGPDSVPVGFMASPGERVTVGDGGGGGAVSVNIQISTGVQQTVRAEMIQLMPKIRDAAVDAVLEARQRGGRFSAAFS